MAEAMSYLFPHEPKDYAYWTIESLSEFIARAFLGSYGNFNYDSILKTKQNKTRNSNRSNRKVALIFFIKFQGVCW